MQIRFPGDWYIERLTHDEIHGHLVGRRVARIRTRYQVAEIVDTRDYGRCLFLDGLVQSTEIDEFVYHESMIHPALLFHPDPRRVFIGGGGEGANLRELVKHSGLKEIVMVDIDEQVVGLARKYLWKWHRGSYEDPRVKLHFRDARDFLIMDKTKYDCIYLDLCDPGEGGPAQKLFTVEFYRLLRRRLTPGGLAVIQAGSADFNMAWGFSGVYKSLLKAFRLVLPYFVTVPSFIGPWAFFLVRNEPWGRGDGQATIARRFKQRKLEGQLRFYDPEVHRAAFTLPPCFVEMLAQGKPITERGLLRVKRS